jgi:hypothetical protein
MTTARPAAETVASVDNYCAAYRDLFQDVGSFDHFPRLQPGSISDVARNHCPRLLMSPGPTHKRSTILSRTLIGIFLTCVSAASNSHARH